MLLSPGAIGAVTEILSATDFYRESHGVVSAPALRCTSRASPSTPLPSSTRSRSAATSSRWAAAPHPRARRARPRDSERGALRADRARDGDAARPRPRGRRDRPARTGPARRDHRPRRPGRADRLRPRPAAGHERLQPHRRAAEGELRADHAPLRGRRRRHRLSHRLQGARQAHVGLPAGEPDHHRRPAVDGEVRARAEHGTEPRASGTTFRSRSSRSRCRRAK